MIIDQIDRKGSKPQNQKNEIGSIFHVFKTILYLCLLMSKLDPCLQSVSPTTSNSLNEEIDKQSVLDDHWIEDVGDSDRQSHLDDPFDWELEEPIDISIGSDASHDDSDLINESMSEFEIQEEDLREDVFDKIIDAFTVKRRKAIIDQEQDVDLAAPRYVFGPPNRHEPIFFMNQYFLANSSDVTAIFHLTIRQ